MADELDANAVRGKITLLPGHDTEFTSVTFCIMDEDHTIGNALRYMLMKDPRVEFCGYTLPHPSENKIHMRVQMYEQTTTAISAVRDALDNLDQLFGTIEDTYRTSLMSSGIEREPAPTSGASSRKEFSA